MKKLNNVLLMVSILVMLNGCWLIKQPTGDAVTRVCPEYPVPSVEVVEILGPIANEEQAVKDWFNQLYKLQRSLDTCQPE